MRRRLLLTGAGSAATSNLSRGLRAGYRSLTIVGCHSDRFLLKKSSADRNYLVPALAHPDYFAALRRVIARERVDLLIPTTDAEVRAFTRPRTRLPCRLFLPRKSVVDLCQDKYRLNVALRAHGVPVPATYPVSSLRALDAIFARLPRPVWCRVRSGSGSTGAIPVTRAEQARSWIAYWTEMRGVPATSFILSEYLPGRDFSCQAIWKSGALVLVKTCERLSYFGGGGNPSGTSSISQLAKTVFAPEVVAVCTAAIRAIDSRASGTFNFDLRESSRGVPCLTEINAGRFPSGTNIFDLTGRVNLAATFVRVALDEPVSLRETYDPAEGYYSVRDLDTPTGVFHADELFDKIVDARGSRSSPKPGNAWRNPHALQVTAEERSVAEDHAQVQERPDQEAVGQLQEERPVPRQEVQGDGRQIRIKRERPERVDHIRIVGHLDPHDAEALQLEIRRLAKRYGRIKDLQIETARPKPDGRSA